MDLAITDVLRGCVSSIMNAVLLFLMAQPRYSKRVTRAVIFSIFVIDILTSLYFYKVGAVTALAKFDVLLFLALGLALKPFVKDSIAKWLFHLLTAINIYFIIAYISYYLCDFFPYPFYANSFVRFLLYLGLMVLYTKKFRPIYRALTENWKIYFVLVLSITMNFTYYIFASDDIEATFNDQAVYLFLLIFLVILVYITIFYLLQKDLVQQKTKQEKLRFRQLAYRDTLTGVGNRNGYEELLEEVKVLTDKERICVCVFDINNLKIVNDTKGHNVGDQYIIDCCQVICKAHQTSAVFRIGGDEFIAVCEDASDTFVQESIEAMASLTEQYNNKDRPYQVSIAHGYEFFNGKKHKTLDDAKNDADKVMYKNKKMTKENQARNG